MAKGKALSHGFHVPSTLRVMWAFASTWCLLLPIVNLWWIISFFHQYISKTSLKSLLLLTTRPIWTKLVMNSAWVVDWLGGWLTGWVIDWVSDWLGEWLTGWVIDWVVDWLGGWWLGEWLTGWVIDCVVDWLGGWLTGWVIDWVVDWLGGWLTGSVIVV